MKKSLLVVPAMGVLLLAAAGSVGGTVAWFSSASSVDASTNVFQAIPLDGNLELTMRVGVGTKRISDKAIKVGTGDHTGDRLTHASYDHNEDTLFTKSSENAKGVRPIASNGWLAKQGFDGTNDIYYAVSWEMIFKYTFATEDQAFLFLDPQSTFDTATGAYAYDGSKLNTVKGFRIAFVGQAAPNSATTFTAETAAAYNTANNLTGADAVAANDSVPATTSGDLPNTRVWAAQRSDNDTLHYIQKDVFEDEDVKTDISTGVYANPDYDAQAAQPEPETLPMNYDGDIITGSYSATNVSGEYTERLPEGQAVNTDKTDYAGCLGKFVNDTTNNESYSLMKFKCVAWFEGTDNTIVSSADTILNQITANMHFYVREYKAS